MKKFVIILLIASVASAKVTFDSEDLKSFLDKIIGGVGKIYNTIALLSSQSKEYYKWLKVNGYWDILVEHAKAYGRPYVLQECVDLIKDEFSCSELVNTILNIFR